MSDPHPEDPVDAAYLRAETALDDETLRAARRTRILAAVAQEQAEGLVLRSERRSSQRQTGAWAAAAVIALGVITVTGVERFLPRAPAFTPTAPTAPPNVAPPPEGATSGPPTPAASSRAAPTPSVTADGAEPRSVSRPLQPSVPAAAPTAPELPSPPPPPPLFIPPVKAPVAEASSPTGTQADESDAAASPGMSQAESGRAPSPAQTTRANTAREPLALQDAAARLRAAAAAGRGAEVKELLSRGVPVDAADADGETALMKSIRADRPAMVSLLLEHGASAERTNKAGLSARALAAAENDPRIIRAIGLQD